MRLSVAETEIYLMYGRGMRIREIAAARGVREGTVKRQMSEARENTQARSTTHLAVMVALAHERRKCESEREKP